MNRLARLTTLYTLIALLAIGVNLLTQMMVIWAYHGNYAIPISVLIGTVAGLPVKYVLEKRFIFSFRSKDLKHDGQVFILYSFMGVFTTALFWAIEFAFHLLFNTNTMRYVGGAIGLTIGNIIKYHLDKRFVFTVQKS
jgi:putative flippase GtrA